MKISLRQLILLVALISIILTLISSMISGYQVERRTLKDNTLETNRVYAQKLATTTDLYINMMLQSLGEVSKDLSIPITEWNAESESILFHEADRLRRQTNSFNSIVITSADGKVLATSPDSLNLKGRILDSSGGREALKERQAFISKPYLSMTDRLIVFISQPIFDKDENYVGLIGGTIYLLEDNILNDLLGDHYYLDGSYVFVVDGEGNIIYHQNKERIGDQVKTNPVVQELMSGRSGSMQLINSQNIDMLAGFAYIPTVDWGVVSQRPTKEALAPSTAMVKKMILHSFPLLLISIIIVVFISKLIAEPLSKLAYYTETTITNNNEKNIEEVRAWYYESIQLKKALANSLGFLHKRVNYFLHQSTTDPLTKLMNRRGLDEQMKTWEDNEIPFSIILLDIDRFKLVNDTYGHAVGDEVLKFLAKQMQEISRDGDVCCRFGGEEFIMLMPNTESNEAYYVAERLRVSMENTVSPTGNNVTISSGIASYPNQATSISDLFEKADKCLYEAKNSGRNRSIAYGNNEQDNYVN